MKAFDHTTPEGQKQMCDDALRRITTVCTTFNEIQTGPNPLSGDEVRRLIEKRPAMYAILEAHATRE